MSSLNYFGPTTVVVGSGDIMPGLPTGNDKLLIIYSADYSDWNNPDLNSDNFEPWMNEITRMVQTSLVNAELGNEGVQISAPRAGVGTLSGVTRETTTYTVTVYGRQVTSAETDPDDIVT